MWDVLQVFMQEMIYHVRSEIRILKHTYIFFWPYNFSGYQKISKQAQEILLKEMADLGLLQNTNT